MEVSAQEDMRFLHEWHHEKHATLAATTFEPILVYSDGEEEGWDGALDQMLDAADDEDAGGDGGADDMEKDADPPPSEGPEADDDPFAFGGGLSQRTESCA